MEFDRHAERRRWEAGSSTLLRSSRPDSTPPPACRTMLRSLLLLAHAQHAALAAEGGGYGAATAACSDHDFVDRTAAVNAECCNEKAEDCSSGRPTTCNPGCARVLLPYFADCKASLGLFAADFADVVALCHGTGEGGHQSSKAGWKRSEQQPQQQPPWSLQLSRRRNGQRDA